MVKGAVREKIWLGSRTKKAIKKGAKKVEMTADEMNSLCAL